MRTARASLLAWALLAVPARAAVSLSAQVDRVRAAPGEQLTLTVTVSGDQASLPSPRLPVLDGFNAYDAGRSQSVSFVNGRVTSSVAHTYVLEPRSAGRLRIPPITAEGAAPTEPIEVEVAAGGAAPAAAPAATPAARARAARGEDVFATASLDKPRVRVNEQATLTIRLMNAVQLVGDLRYEPPDLAGFLVEELPPVRTSMTRVDGRPYQVSEIKVALFPVQAGRLRVGPATLRAQALGFDDPGSPQDFFDRFFQMAAPRTVAVRTEPLTLQVDPLPPGAPPGFSGVVGRLSASASADRTSVKAGEAVTLTVAVTGTGNLKALPEPPRPDSTVLRYFETESSLATDKSGDRVGGRKTFRTVVVPRASGTALIPPFRFSYYDPQRGAYASAETAPIELRVAPADPGAAPPPGTAADAPGVAPLADDVRYLKAAPRRAPASRALAAFGRTGPWHSAPFAALAASALLAWRRRRAAADPAGRRAREALARAREKLARGLPDEALAGYVADKTGGSAAGLTLRTALERLRSRPAPPSEALLARLSQAWEEAHLRRFAPGAAGDSGVFSSSVSALLGELERFL